MSWNNLSIDKSLETKSYGVISKDSPSNISLDFDYKIEIDNIITENDCKFINKNNHMDNENTLKLDKSLSNFSSGMVFRLKYLNDIIGFIISFPHSINYDGLIEKIVLSTYLCIDENYRKKNYAMIMIQTAIINSYKNNILCGYHFTENPITNSNVKVSSWFRPLNIENCEKVGYEIPYPKSNYSNIKNITYKLDSKEKIKIATYDDIKNVLSKSNRILKINIPTKSEWIKLNLEPLIWLVCPQNGLLCYRDFPILEYPSTFKCCQIVFYEMNGDIENRIKSFRGMLTFLKRLKYDVVHGLNMGPLCDIEDRCRLIRTSIMYLDFYNFSIKKLNNGNINLFYI